MLKIVPQNERLNTMPNEKSIFSGPESNSASSMFRTRPPETAVNPASTSELRPDDVSYAIPSIRPMIPRMPNRTNQTLNVI